MGRVSSRYSMMASCPEGAVRGAGESLGPLDQRGRACKLLPPLSSSSSLPPSLSSPSPFLLLPFSLPPPPLLSSSALPSPSPTPTQLEASKAKRLLGVCGGGDRRGGMSSFWTLNSAELVLPMLEPPFSSQSQPTFLPLTKIYGYGFLLRAGCCGHT